MKIPPHPSPLPRFRGRGRGEGETETYFHPPWCPTGHESFTKSSLLKADSLDLWDLCALCGS
jgi:hypothetical protein